MLWVMVTRKLALALFAASLPALANSIILTGLNAPLGEQQTLWINEQGKNTRLYWAGAFDGNVDGFSRVLWCVQPFVELGVNTTYHTVIDWADTPQLQRAGWLVQNMVSGITTQAQGAAFQLAIWDIMEDDGDGFEEGAGNLYASTSKNHPTDAVVLALALGYETQSVGKLYEWVPVYRSVTIGRGDPVQDLIGGTMYDDGPFGETPEPPESVLICGGLVLIALGSRKVRSQFSLRGSLRRSRSLERRSASVSTR